MFHKYPRNNKNADNIIYIKYIQKIPLFLDIHSICTNFAHS